MASKLGFSKTWPVNSSSISSTINTANLPHYQIANPDLELLVRRENFSTSSTSVSCYSFPRTTDGSLKYKSLTCPFSELLQDEWANHLDHDKALLEFHSTEHRGFTEYKGVGVVQAHSRDSSGTDEI
jgi:hypothetical protein